MRRGEDRVAKQLPKRKTGPPLMMGEHLDWQVQAYLRNLGKAGGGVNKELSIVSARKIIQKNS